MSTINPYLNFSGNTEEAFNFYKSVFGGEFSALQRYGDAPGQDHTQGDDAKRIMHISLPIGKTAILMGSDRPSVMGKVTKGDNFLIAIAPDSEAEAKKLFDALSAGGTITMALDKTFWGAYFGMLTDKFGIQWMVNYMLPE